MNQVIIKILAVFTLFSSCTVERTNKDVDEFELKYVNIWRSNQQIDTTYMHLNSITFQDSIYTANYTEIDFDGDTIQRSYELPISNSENTFANLTDTSEFRLRYEGLRYIDYGKQYTVYKYLFDDPNGDDEATNYYFVPEFGIVIIKARAWGSYGRLITNSQPNDFDKIFYLTEKVVGDFDNFYFPLKE